MMCAAMCGSLKSRFPAKGIVRQSRARDIFFIPGFLKFHGTPCERTNSVTDG